RSVATGVNERPVDVQSRGVTEPQRDAVSEADGGIDKKLMYSLNFLVCTYPLRRLIRQRHLPLQQGEAELGTANFKVSTSKI
ncbi:MAG: hypothetical protein PUE34_03250, partial [Clostridiaceae bacterium]|nr:hypothetical protein [Clostridiaceae bacterium]